MALELDSDDNDNKSNDDNDNNSNNNNSNDDNISDLSTRIAKSSMSFRDYDCALLDAAKHYYLRGCPSESG